MTSCATCLGVLDSSRNLCEPNSRKLLDLLLLLLGFQVDIKNDIFLVCSKCVKQLLSISEFQETCQKCYVQFRVRECKEEIIDAEFAHAVKITLDAGDDDFGFEPQNDDSDSYNNVDGIKKLKKEKQPRHNTKKAKVDRAFANIGGVKVRCTRKFICQQFPKEDILKAIAECRSFLTDIKNKTCIHCNFVVSATKLLPMHMKGKHPDLYETWCSRCNLQTDNLQDHLEATNCSEKGCKFCHKTFKNLSAITRHLESHCIVGITVNPDDEECDSDRNSADSDSFFNKEDSQKKKKKKKQPRSAETTEKSTDDKALDNNSGIWDRSIQKSLYQQFPKQDVLKAIRECTNVISDIKNRTCIYCGIVTSASRSLTVHMKVKHLDLFETWCRRCNLQTENLHIHMETTNCFENACKFCHRAFKNTCDLRRHLRTHCRKTLHSDDEDLAFEPHNDDSDSSCHKEDGQKHKKEKLPPSSETTKKADAKPKEDKVFDTNSGIWDPSVQKSLYQQFPKEDVLKAIAECTNFKTDIKNKTCIHCDIVTTVPRSLTVHMKSRHEELYDTWCRRCNLQTNNLEVHMEATNCYENTCKFCRRAFKKTCDLTRHLRTHCRKNLDTDDEDLDSEPHNGDSDSYHNVDDNNKRKKEKQSPKSAEKSKEDKAFDINSGSREHSTRKYGCQQFPKEDVLRAIAECTDYITNIKNKTCLHCELVLSATKLLTTHMKAKHKKFYESWCRRCNLQTDNLQVHMEATNCFENRCKFCHKTFKKTSDLTRHYEYHCKLLGRSEQLSSTDYVRDFLSTKSNTSGAKSVQCKLEADSTSDWLELDDSTNFEYVGLKLNLKEETLNTDTEHAVQCESTEVPICSTFQLFDHEEVLKAISASRRLFQANRNCVICDFLSSNTSELSNHMTVEHKEERHKWCRICNTIVDDLTKHRSDHRKDQLKCTFCEQNFGTIYHLIYHLKRHSDVYKSGEQLIWFTCKVCLNFYPNALQLKNHECNDNIDYRDETEKRVRKSCGFSNRSGSTRSDTRGVAKRRIDNKMDQFPAEEVKNAIDDTLTAYKASKKCIICDNERIDSKMLSLHMAIMHRQLRSTWCSLCNTLVDDLPNHKQGHSNDLLKCKFCGRSFTKLRTLSKHLELHSRSLFGNKEIWYDCDVCPNTYPDVLQLKDHECQGPDPDHNGKKIKIISSFAGATRPSPNLCTICGKKFRSERTLADHMKVHSSKKMNVCSYCDKKCDSKPALLIHIRSHTGERPFLCNICGKAFKSRGTLKTHLLTHSGPKEECTICHKRFCHRSYLKSHMQLHTGAKRFLCNICGKRFQLNGTLVQHMRRHHNFGKPYKCRFCEKDFKTYDLRTYHEDKHRGIKTLRCSKCRYTCKTPEKFANHMKKHSAMDPQREPRHKCLICHKQFSMKAMLTLHINNQHDEIV